MDVNQQRCRNLLVALRKIIQAIDQHSTQLKKKFGLTGPQLIILQTVIDNESITVTRLSKNVSLSQATATNITKRLESQGYLEQKKTRQINAELTFWLRKKGWGY